MTNTIIALLVFITLIALFGVLLSWLSDTNSDDTNSENSTGASENDTTETIKGGLSGTGVAKTEQQLIDAVNNVLPQTQCAQCSYPGCRPYATAIIRDDAPINQCPPGGEPLIKELASLLGKETVPLDTAFGENKPPQIALIDENVCIGCTLCIAACPVDAIVGASRLMHTVIADQCTGCELCLPPCPVDCIELVPKAITLSRWRWPHPA